MIRFPGEEFFEPSAVFGLEHDRAAPLSAIIVAERSRHQDADIAGRGIEIGRMARLGLRPQTFRSCPIFAAKDEIAHAQRHI